MINSKNTRQIFPEDSNAWGEWPMLISFPRVGNIRRMMEDVFSAFFTRTIHVRLYSIYAPQPMSMFFKGI